MRIAHAAYNICGIPALLARTQRQFGYQATAVVYPGAQGPVPQAVDLGRLQNGGRLSRHWRRARVVGWAASTYSVFHFHFHTTFTLTHRDLPLFKALGKKVVFHLHGCDIRDPRRMRVEREFSACSECTYPCMVPVKLRLPAAIQRHADAVLVSTPDLLEFVPGAVYLPSPVDAAPWQRLSVEPRHRPGAAGEWIVVHAPTNREIKGTRHIIAAVEQLRRDGFPIQLRIYEDMDQGELRRACVEADVVVDQVLMGWIGVFGTEMLAMGKPVIAYLRSDLLQHRPDLPVEHADPGTLADTLRRLLEAPRRREELARLGPPFVHRYHDPEALGRRLVELYLELGAA